MLLNFSVRNEQNAKLPIIVNERKYHLNNSKSKFVTVGLSYDFGFQPCITFGGDKTINPIVLSETDWKELELYQSMLVNYFYSCETYTPLSLSSISISFGRLINNNKFVKIMDKKGSYVCFGLESFTQLRCILPLIDFRLNSLKKLNFQNYFNTKIDMINDKSGDICQKILNSMTPAVDADSENDATMMELLYLYPSLPEFINLCNQTYYAATY